jgi:hypothetical protein
MISPMANQKSARRRRLLPVLLQAPAADAKGRRATPSPCDALWAPSTHEICGSCCWVRGACHCSPSPPAPRLEGLLILAAPLPTARWLKQRNKDVPEEDDELAGKHASAVRPKNAAP